MTKSESLSESEQFRQYLTRKNVPESELTVCLKVVNTVGIEDLVGNFVFISHVLDGTSFDELYSIYKSYDLLGENVGSKESFQIVLDFLIEKGQLDYNSKNKKYYVKE